MMAGIASHLGFYCWANQVGRGMKPDGLQRLVAELCIPGGGVAPSTPECTFSGRVE